MFVHQIGRDVTVLSDPAPVPGIGFLAVNAFVLHAAEPVVVDTVREVPAGDLRDAQLLWASVDRPWVHTVDRDAYLATMRPIRAAEPEVVLSTHLPPAYGQLPQLLDMLAAAPATEAFVGPDQRALAELLATFEPGPTAS